LTAPLAEVDALVAAALGGDRRSLGRLLSTLENDPQRASRITAGFAQRIGRAHVVGITGVPGAGKSTLINGLLGLWLARGERVAVVAIDPASPRSGGAVLGDRVRMGEHGSHPKLFIRSLSARGATGGLAPAARAVVDAFDAAGYERVVVETVGAGQSEVEIMALADTRVVVCPPGLGDEVQAIKAGILEVADVLAVSKADLALADRTARELRDMLTLRRGDGAPIKVIRVSAIESSGLADLVGAIDAHGAQLKGRQRLPADNPAGDEASADAMRADSAQHPLQRMRGFVARDRAVYAMGIRLVSGGLGHAEVALEVSEQHLNFNGHCHGGVIFTLADTAFGLASNSHGAFAAGIDAHITYQAAVGAGDTLHARATELSRGRRIAVYRVDVTRRRAGEATMAASFTGTVYIK
jgi:LAO/AO transport system ATPase/phenylacetic acid degradation protein PaaD